MPEIHLIDVALFIGAFLIGTAIIRIFSQKIALPYTVALLVTGFIAQFFTAFFHIEFGVRITPDFIFFFLLPMLLFESAMHINFHQFRLQFKTISFFATFGLLLSIFVIGVAGTYLLGIPIGVALLFGAIISATDPIAVLALFKVLGAPKRLALVADGESMFNDATGVIAFRVISTYVVGAEVFGAQKLLPSFFDLVYIFIGSIIVGTILGYVTSRIFEKIKGERLIITALTGALAIGSFAGAEHFLHLSGVITTVMAGITLGNLARSKMHAGTVHFLEEFWEYIGFLSLSLVFFFAAYNLDISLFTKEIEALSVVILIVLIARSVSVYLTAFLSNNLPFFKDEPDIPLSWQHILNWGGLRGVVPLVLVYSLPDDFTYKPLMLQFTLVTLLFTLLVNGLTIKKLLIALKLHLPRKEEEIVQDELTLFQLATKRDRLSRLPSREFDKQIIHSFDQAFAKQEEASRKHLLRIATPEEFLLSLKLEALAIERQTLLEQFEQGRMSEATYYEFDSELDLQQDALEYPDVFSGRGIERGGFVHNRVSFRKRLFQWRRSIREYNFIARFFGVSEETLLSDRYSLLRARIFTSYAVLDYLEKVGKLFPKKQQQDAIGEVLQMQKYYIDRNLKQVRDIERHYPGLVKDYQKRVITKLIATAPTHPAL